MFQALFKQQIESKIRQKSQSDSDSILGTYHRVNPDLKVPELNNTITCNESERKIITRYRTGCHKLKIQTGRLAGDGRDTRHCLCGNSIQTVSHVLFSCPLTTSIREIHNIQCTNLHNFFNDMDSMTVSMILKAVTKKLKV